MFESYRELRYLRKFIHLAKGWSLSSEELRAGQAGPSIPRPDCGDTCVFMREEGAAVERERLVLWSYVVLAVITLEWGAGGFGCRDSCGHLTHRSCVLVPVCGFPTVFPRDAFVQPLALYFRPQTPLQCLSWGLGPSSASRSVPGPAHQSGPHGQALGDSSHRFTVASSLGGSEFGCQ